MLVLVMYLIVTRIKKRILKSGSCAIILKDSTLVLSHAAIAINLVLELIIGEITLEEIGKRLPLTRIASLSFTIVFSLQSTSNNLNFNHLPINNSKLGSK